MNTFDRPSKSVIYVMDAYCGWCWGFSERMGEFEAANRHRVAFTAISGGLFTGERARPISAYAHIPEANARIARLTGAHFRPAYQRLLQEGTMVMDSLGAATALAALRDLAPQRVLQWAHRLQEAFYERGQNPSEPATIAEIVTAAGLDAGEAVRRLQGGSPAPSARPRARFKRRVRALFIGDHDCGNGAAIGLQPTTHSMPSPAGLC